MAVTSGFYNSVNGDRKYNADQFSTLFEGIINDGVFASIGTSLVVTANAGMNVNVGVGRAWFNLTWTDNDSILPLVVPASEMVLNRIDAVVVEVNTTDAVRLNTIKVVKGIPASVPVNPVMVETATVHQHPLCYIAVGASVTNIIQANITNLVGTATCPFITGILETMTIEGVTSLLEAEFNAWFEDIQAQLAGDVAGNLQNQINDINNDLPGIISNTRTDSYLSFCANVNSTNLDAAFGKLNETEVVNIGKQLAMYAWFKGKDKMANPYTTLLTKNTLLDICNDITLRDLMATDSTFLALILASPYATSVVFNLTRPISDAAWNTILFSATLRPMLLANYAARTVVFNANRPVVVYDKGDQKLTLTNGYTAYQVYGTTQILADRFKVIWGSGSNGGGVSVRTTPKFALTGFNKKVYNVVENIINSTPSTLGPITIDDSTLATDIWFTNMTTYQTLAVDKISLYCA